MRAADLSHIEGIVAAANDDPTQLSRSDYVSLLILTRDSASRGSSLKDLGHCVAHDERDRGYTFDYLNSFARKIRGFLTYGGPLRVRVLSPIEQVVDEINELLPRQGSAARMTAGTGEHRDSLALGIADAVAGTKFQIKGANCELSLTAPTQTSLHATVTIWLLDAINGAIPYPPNGPGLAFPWLIPDAVQLS